MLHGIAENAIAVPRRILAVAVLVLIAAAIFGVPVLKNLSAGGSVDPAAESSKAAALLAQKFGQGTTGMVITVTSEAGALGPRASSVGADLAARLKNSPSVEQVRSAWTVPPAAADRKSVV